MFVTIRLISDKSYFDFSSLIQGNSMAWVYLILAGFMEIGWPVGLKIAQDEKTRILGIVIAIFFMAISGLLYGWLKNKFLLERRMLCGQVLEQRDFFSGSLLLW